MCFFCWSSFVAYRLDNFTNPFFCTVVGFISSSEFGFAIENLIDIDTVNPQIVCICVQDSKKYISLFKTSLVCKPKHSANFTIKSNFFLYQKVNCVVVKLHYLSLHYLRSHCNVTFRVWHEMTLIVTTTPRE